MKIALLGPKGVFMQKAAQLEQSAQKGDLNARIDLGWILIRKNSRLPDPDRAVTLFREAAGKGAVRAQYALGWAYAKGRGVPVDYTQAAEWYRVAATAGGDADAQFALGELYFRGLGVANGRCLLTELASAFPAAGPDCWERRTVRSNPVSWLYSEPGGVAKELWSK